MIGGRRSGSSSISGGARFSTTTQDTLLPPDTLLIPDIIIPPSSLLPPPGLQPPTRRSSAESPGITPELKQIEHVSQLDFPEEGAPCLFCRSAPTSSTHDPSMLSTLSGGKLLQTIGLYVKYTLQFSVSFKHFVNGWTVHGLK